MAKKTLCVDFDGVIHSYTSGWGGHETISDPPVEGAIEFLYDALKVFKVAIYSSRSANAGGVAAMQRWIAEYAKPFMFDYGAEWWLALEWPTSKPSAWVTIDDRAITFTGPDGWPSMQELVEFKPWYQLPKLSSLKKAVEFLATEGNN